MRDDRYHERWLAQFLARVDRSGGPDACWPWLGLRDKDGYGLVSHRRRHNYERTHRMAWEIANGPIEVDVLILHTCDTPPCCNDAHLFDGTHMDNVRDKLRKGRWGGNPTKRVQLQCTYPECGKTYIRRASAAKTSKYCCRFCRAKDYWFLHKRNTT